MTESTTKVAVVKTKSIFKTQTMWGAILAAAPVILPIISTLTGIDVTEDEVNAGIATIQNAVAAGASVIGFIMVIYGRFKAGRVASPVEMGTSETPVTVVAKDAKLVENVGTKSGK